MNQNSSLFAELCRIIARLRDPQTGCPWDIKQTHTSLKPYLLEEAYETLEAIDLAEPSKLKEELGDILLQVLLHSQIASDNKEFTISDVITVLSKKMIDRHPHVFGDAKADTAEDVTRNWQKSKKKEASQSSLGDIPRSLPALAKAELIGKRVATVGFDWESAAAVKLKVAEELNEFLEAEQSGDPAACLDEFGDLLFSLTQLARWNNISAEAALQQGCAKFNRRFEAMEKLAGGSLDGKSKAELEDLWQQVKLALA